MTRATLYVPDPRLDLFLERVVDVPRELLWEAWTRPEHIKAWFTPAPWQTADCEIDLRPGGIFRTVFRSPEGKDSTNLCCYLEVVPNEKLVWTSALQPGFRPGNEAFPGVPPTTVVIQMADEGEGRTHYTAVALHADERSREKHDKMGFLEGWGVTTDQLMELAKGLRR